MGDVAMIVPVLRALTLQYPKVRVTVVSRASYQPFFEGMKQVSFFAADVDGKHKGFLGLLQLYRELKALHITHVADLHNVLRSKIITTLFSLRGKETATTDKARAEKKALTRPDNKVFKPLLPVPQRHAEVFKKLGLPIDLNSPVFPEKKEINERLLELTGEKNSKWIGIAPFAQHRSKIYPHDLIRVVIDNLAQNTDYKIFLFGGGKAEAEVMNSFANNSENVVVMAGKTNLKGEMELISNLDLMVSMDSGNAHIAAMLGVKVVSLWGATHPYAGYGAFNQPVGNALVSDREQYPMLPTSVYGNKKVEGYEDAMRTITPESVLAKIKEVLR
ncbi:MAG: lipopolysaccharide heptosyltransferase family protein [Flavobacterium sp.]|nr:MAG: lipopolysaccharide heptosyltransferase family protein [Flavobacterium sp.]